MLYEQQSEEAPIFYVYAEEQPYAAEETLIMEDPPLADEYYDYVEPQLLEEQAFFFVPAAAAEPTFTTHECGVWQCSNCGFAERPRQVRQAFRRK